MLIPNDVRIGPPRVRVGMAAAVGGHDRRPTLHFAVDRAVVEVEVVHVFEVEHDRAFFAVDLQAVLVLIAGGEAGRFEGASGAPLETREKRGGVIDINFTFLGRPPRRAGGDAALAAGLWDLALLDESFGDAAIDGVELVARNKPRHVDDVRAQIAVRAGAGDFLAEAPDERDVRAGPVLEIVSADVIDATEPPLLHKLVGERDGGTTAVDVPDGGLGLLRLARRVAHGAGVVEAAGERLLTRDVLAGFERGDGHFGMGIIRTGHIDQVDLRVLDRS